MNRTNVESGLVKLSNGETFNVYVSGNGKDPMIMLHGMWLDHRSLKPTFPYLEEKFKIIAPDFRGHGQSTYENPVSGVNDFVDDIRLLIEYFGLEKVYLFGWCGGSSVGLKYASMYGDTVEKIIIVSPPGLEGLPLFKGKDKGEKTHIENKEDLKNHPSLSKLEKALAEKDRDTLRSIIQIVNFNNKQPDQEILECLVDQIELVKNVWDIAWSAYTCNLTDHKKWITEGSGAILRVSQKTLLFYGEDDTLIPRFAIDQYLEYLGDNVVLKLVKDGGHAVHLLDTKYVAEEVIRFCFSEN